MQKLRLKFLFYAAAASVALAGALHLADLLIDTEHSENASIATFFIITGIAQIFWILPTVKCWSRSWHYIGIVGNAALIALWSLTRIPNPISGGEAEPIDRIGIIVQVAQISYILLITAAISRQRPWLKADSSSAADAV
jgi:hypothetical protein